MHMYCMYILENQNENNTIFSHYVYSVQGLPFNCQTIKVFKGLQSSSQRREIKQQQKTCNTVLTYDTVTYLM